MTENKANWWEVYNDMAKLLFEFQKKHKKNSGRILYDQFMRDPSFLKLNNWVSKFDASYDVICVDPIHIFASFHGISSSDNIRVQRINNLFKLVHKVLKSSGEFKEYSHVNFVGCPTLNTRDLLSAREVDRQLEIWDFFGRVHDGNRGGLNKADFDDLTKWYGIEFDSLTIFLYWIKSDYFLPLDRNVKNFIFITNLVEAEPHDYESYVQLLNKIEKFNTDEDHSDNHFEGLNFGKKGLFREISQLAHFSINSEFQISRYPLRFLKFYDSEKVNADTGESHTKKSIDEAQKRVANAIGRKFKIIAIKPLENCAQEYLKILRKNQIYYFETAFEITNQGIYYDGKKNISLYNTDNIKINVTAIVGKNGSGKSSLIELFFRTINNIAFLLKDNLLTPDLEFENNLAVELFYIMGGHLFSLKLNNRSILIQEYELHDHIYKKEGAARKFLSSDLKKFFFTIAINYSHYSLNSKYLGKWIDHFFHKNDAYQSPLIINPNRVEGNIDINLENDLIKSQLLANLFDSVDDDDDGIRQLTPNQKAFEVEFKFKTKGIEHVHMDENRQTGLYIPKTDRDEIFSAIYEHFNFQNKKYSKRLKVVQETEKFILLKLVEISNTHTQYAKYYSDKARHSKVKKYSLSEYILSLQEDSSHITYELKQAINYLNFYDLIPKTKSFTLQLDELSNKKSHEYTRWPGIESKELVEILPPPIFESRIKLINNLNVNSDFDLLSSGEKQQIHAISTILYHLRNLDKLIATKSIPYSKVNLLLDEIELYYHPEMQKRYLNYMLNMIKKMAFNNIDAINICLVTHSPYILSDIPSSFTLQLKDGQPFSNDNKTFGANIHDLLANDFFMEDGFMGEFARTQIEEAIAVLNNLISQEEELKRLNDELQKSGTENNTAEQGKIDSLKNMITELKSKKQSIRNVISLIGETVIKNKLEDMFRLAFKKEDSKEMTKNKILELAAKEDIKITFTDN